MSTLHSAYLATLGSTILPTILPTYQSTNRISNITANRKAINATLYEPYFATKISPNLIAFKSAVFSADFNTINLPIFFAISLSYFTANNKPYHSAYK